LAIPAVGFINRGAEGMTVESRHVAATLDCTPMAQPTQCTICLSDKRHQVEIALVHRVPLRVIAKRYGLSFDAIWRHGKKHLSPQMRAAILAAQRPQAVDLEQLQRSEAEGILAQLVSQRARLQLAVEQAQEFGNTADVVKAEKAITDNLTLVAKLLGQLVQHHQVTHASVLVSPDYLRLRSVMVETLRPFPDAALAVGKALHRLESEAAEQIKRDAANCKRPVLIEAAAERVIEHDAPDRAVAGVS